MTGAVVALYRGTIRSGPLESCAEIRAVAGVGVEGDRFAIGEGVYATKKGPDREITLIEEEAIRGAARDSKFEMSLDAPRRNIVTRGVALNHLVEREFAVGGAVLRGIRLNEPCAHLEKLLGNGLMNALLHRGGLRAQILRTGVIRVDDVIRPREGAEEWRRDSLLITTDRSRIDEELVYGFLSRQSYWAAGIPLTTFRRSVDHAVCFSMFDGDRQIGFCRVMSDFATFAYIGDVFVLPGYRGRGLAKWLMECVAAHPRLQGLRRHLLATRDAHGLYEKCGFTPLKNPQNFLERHFPDVYRTPGAAT